MTILDGKGEAGRPMTSLEYLNYLMVCKGVKFVVADRWGHVATIQFRILMLEMSQELLYNFIYILYNLGCILIYDARHGVAWHAGQ